MTSHTYTSGGSHDVTLTVTDNDSNTAQKTRKVTSSDSGLVARFRTKKDDSNNLKIWFNGEYSHDAEGNDVSSLYWDFGDGTYYTEGTPMGGDYGWLYIDNADRIIDWSKAGVWYGGVKGIPTYPVSGGGVDLTGLSSYGGYTLDSTGVNDSTAAIQAAINACANYHAVYLPAGTYRINGAIFWNAYSGNRAVVLRGAGALSTELKQYGTTTDTISIYGGSTGTSTSVSSGYTKGSQSIVVASASGFAVNDYVRLGESSTSGSHDPLMVEKDGATFDTNIMGYESECKAQFNQITSISGTTIGLKRPLYTNYVAGCSPTLAKVNMIVNSGVEDLKISQVSGGSSTANIRFTLGAYCWVKGVEGNYCNSNHVEFQACLGNEVRFSYFHHAFVYTSGRGYAVWLFDRCTDCLVEDNIMYYVRHCANTEYGGQGNVIAYNYAARIFGDSYPSDNYLMESIHTHGGYPIMNLFEGNVTAHIVLDDALGGSLWNTVFRNWSQGYSLNYAGTGNMTTNLNCLEIQRCNRYVNVIGNVLGMSGFSGYSYKGALVSSKYVYRLGNDQSDGSDPDTRCESTSMFHGNYDYPLDETVWTDGLPHDIPDSLYLSSKPSFFGSIGWPPIGPDVSGYLIDIPAKVRYDSGEGHYFDAPPA